MMLFLHIQAQINVLNVWEKGHIETQWPNKRATVLLESGETISES